MNLQSEITKPTIESLHEDQLTELATFIAEQSGRNCDQVASHLRWFWLSNPALRPDDPLGFALLSTRRIVGCILCVPQIFRCQPEEIVIMGSSSFYVDEQFRGHGGRLFLQFSRLSRTWPLFGTSANAEAAALWKAAGATAVPHSDSELFGVFNWLPIAEEVVHRRYSNRLLDRILGSSVLNLAKVFVKPRLREGRGISLRQLKTPEEVENIVAEQTSGKLTSIRDPNYIRWRYFTGQDLSATSFAFRAAPTRREILITVNQRSRGYRSQIRTLNLLDAYPEPSPTELLQVASVLEARFRGEVDAIVFRNQSLENQALLSASGFKRRPFEAPTAWVLDKSKMLPIREWHFVPADGDSLI